MALSKLSSSELAPFLLSVDLETHRAGKDYDFVLNPNISLSGHLQNFVFEISLKVEGRILLPPRALYNNTEILTLPCWFRL